MPDFESLNEAIIQGNIQRVKELTQNMIDKKVEPVSIINEGLIPGMSVVGARFKAGSMYVPEVMMSARAMSGGIALVKPLIAESDMPSSGTVAVGTIKGDLHDIGKNLVIMMMESSGFKVIDLGVDIGADTFVKVVKEQQVQIIGISALLTTTMLNMKDTIDALKEAGLRDQVKIIIGGAPVTREFAEKIGADGYAADAGSAADLCKTLLD